MLQTKNLSPGKISLLISLLLSLFSGVVIMVLEHSWVKSAIFFALQFAGGYFLIFYTIQFFIYRKIKLIYKIIYHTKATRREETYYKYVLPEKSLDEVRKDVEEWAEQRNNELEFLKKNERFRKEFLQNLSHEFKTPVFAIQGYLDILMNHLTDDNAQDKQFLGKAVKNVDRLVTLLKDLDSISKLERGELKLFRQYFVIQDLLKEVFESLSLNAEGQQMKFTIKKGCEKPLTVYADKEKIRQVLTNLVDNSIKYGKQGGLVIASIYQLEGDNTLVEISDDGIGIPEESINRIFERFYRTNSGRGKEIKGTGLGLSICKHIIEAHGHSIHVRSTENVGTTIGFTLDTKKKPDQPEY